MPECLLLSAWQLYEDGGEDDDEGEDGAVSYKEWQLPATDFEGSWDALYYESSIKRHLLQYASSALLFSDRGVNSQLISWNRYDISISGQLLGNCWATAGHIWATAGHC
jgi:hypothetical protein